MLKIKNLNTFYGEIQIIWGISFSIKEGEIVTLLGSNGSGKSTTIKTILGIHRAKSGSITFQDQEITRLATYQIVELGISMVPEGKNIFPYMTVQENLEIGAYPSKARKHLSKAIHWVFDIFPILYDKRNQTAGTLSGGIQQMLAIGRGLMSHPKLLILDEPSLGLAPLIVRELFEVIKTIHKEGVSILLVEQNVMTSLKVASRGYILEGGRIKLEGSASELLQNDYVKKLYLGF